MTQDTSSKSESPAPSASELRMMLLEKQMQEFEKQQKLKDIEKQKRAEEMGDFLKNHVSDKERSKIRSLVMHAVEEGKYETLVYSFSCKLTTDNGRAVNNSDPKWPDTLQGKAKELYELFKQNLQPKGYMLSAMITDFPGGMPGNVGFFLSWRPKDLT